MSPLARAVLLVLLVVTAGAVGTGATAHYDISASPTIDTPTRDVPFENQTFTVSELARVDPGETVSVTVDGPSDELYSVPLYNADREIVDTREGTGRSTVSFDTEFEDGGTYAPGTYVVTVTHNGVFQVVHPLLVVGYRVSVDAPSSETVGEAITVTASLTTVDDAKNVSGAEVVIGNDDRHRRVEMDETGDMEYSATVTLDELGPGSYRLYVGVQGTEAVLGQQEVLGASDPQSFRIVEESDSETTTDDGGGGSDGGSEDTSTTTQATTDTTETATTSAVTTSTSPESPSSPVTTTNSSPGQTTAQTSVDPTTTAPNSAVITPSTPPPTAGSPGSGTSTPGQPLGMVPVVVALVAFAGLLVRRVQ